jgi:Tfp pilus assembly protein PilF
MALRAGLAVVLIALSVLTYRRNQVFSTSERFWRDVLSKAPSARAHLNYGVGLMAANDMSGAMRQFQKSLELAPNWYYTHINLGVAYRSLGDTARAREHFDRAVEYDRYSGMALTWRGENHLALREFAAARDDFLQSMKVSLDHDRNAKGLAAANAGLGDNGDAASQETLMTRGLALLAGGDPVAAAATFREVLVINPTHYGAHYQLAVALDRAGKRSEARPLWEKVLRMADGYNDRATANTARSHLNQKP